MSLRIDLSSLSCFFYDHHQMGVPPRTPPATECPCLGFLSFRVSNVVLGCFSAFNLFVPGGGCQRTLMHQVAIFHLL
jgi:hypothetical protein